MVGAKTLFLALDYLRFAKGSVYLSYLENYLGITHGERIGAKWLEELVESRLVSDNTLYVEITVPDHDLVRVLSQAAQNFFLYEIRSKLDIDYFYEVEILKLQFQTVKNPDISIKREELQQEIDATAASITVALLTILTCARQRRLALKRYSWLTPPWSSCVRVKQQPAKPCEIWKSLRVWASKFWESSQRNALCERKFKVKICFL